MESKSIVLSEISNLSFRIASVIFSASKAEKVIDTELRAIAMESIEFNNFEKTSQVAAYLLTCLIENKLIPEKTPVRYINVRKDRKRLTPDQEWIMDSADRVRSHADRYFKSLKPAPGTSDKGADTETETGAETCNEGAASSLVVHVTECFKAAHSAGNGNAQRLIAEFAAEMGLKF